jgi:hypothetical protein
LIYALLLPCKLLIKKDLIPSFIQPSPSIGCLLMSPA